MSRVNWFRISNIAPYTNFCWNVGHQQSHININIINVISLSWFIKGVNALLGHDGGFRGDALGVDDWDTLR